MGATHFGVRGNDAQQSERERKWKRPSLGHKEINVRIGHGHDPVALSRVHGNEWTKETGRGGSAGDIDWELIRCRIATELKKGPDEVGAMDFPFIGELLEYWQKYPPSHLLLRAIAQFESKEDRGNWRKERAAEIGDDTYVAPSQPSSSSRKEP